MKGNYVPQPQIIFLIDALGIGGAERLLVPYVTRLRDYGFGVRVCALQERSGNPIARDIAAAGVPVDLLPIRRLRHINEVPRLLHYMQHHYASLVHTQLEFSNILGTLLATLLRIPTVATLHNIGNPTTDIRSLARFGIMLRVLKQFSQRVIAVSDETRGYYITHAGFAPERIITLHNGINLEPFIQAAAADSSAHHALRASLGIPPDAPLLITVAVLRQPKGIQYMLDALPAIFAHVPDAYYLVVGNGDYDAPLKKHAHTLGIDKRVIFTGTRNDIPALLAASNLFVLPSLTEALPTVLAEAMAAHKPIIASAVGGIPEMVVHGRNGLLLPATDVDALVGACVQLLQNPLLAQQMGHTGFAIAQNCFEIGRQVERLAHVYNELLAHSVVRYGHH